MTKLASKVSLVVTKLRAARKVRDEIKELISAATPIKVAVAGEAFLFAEAEGSDDTVDMGSFTQSVREIVLEAALTRICKRVKSLESELVEATYD